MRQEQHPGRHPACQPASLGDREPDVILPTGVRPGSRDGTDGGASRVGGNLRGGFNYCMCC